MPDQAAPQKDPALIVISYYDRRSTACLLDLLESLRRYPAGMDFEVLVVVNQTRETLPQLPEFPFRLSILSRPNTGMNIGAWDAGWRSAPGHPVYIFLQDECLIVRDHWLAAYAERCLEPGVGLVGESLNPAWSQPWSKLKAAHAGARMPDHFIDGNPADRVEVYLDCMRRWGIDPGETATHLRSLLWAASGAVLKSIDGFPIGANYGECIAAEIAVSRKVASAGLRVVQVRKAQFYFSAHREWNQDRPGAQHLHDKAPVIDPGWDLPERRLLDEEAERLLRTIDGQSSEADHVLVVSSLLRKLWDRDAQISRLREALLQKESRSKAKQA